MKRVALVIPALNERENLSWLLPGLTSKYLCVVVDNGSTDDTSAVARLCGAVVLSRGKKGYGGAVQTGFQYILGEPALRNSIDAIVVFDADGTSPVEYIDPVSHPILSGAADICIGQRLEKERGAMPAHARFGNWLQTFLIARVSGRSYRDMGPLRALSPRAFLVLEMRDPTWGWNVEMQMKAALLGLRVEELSITYRKRVFGCSKISGTFIGSMRAGSKILAAVAQYAVLGWMLRRRSLLVPILVFLSGSQGFGQ
jgi:glycosyltransferase involved in cell wall biosynthesis